MSANFNSTFHLHSLVTIFCRIFKLQFQKWFDSEKMTLKNWIVGYALAETPTDKAKAFLAMEANHYIYNSNWEKQELSLSQFKSQIYAIERTEARIAQDSGKILKHHKKWDRIKEFL